MSKIERMDKIVQEKKYHESFDTLCFFFVERDEKNVEKAKKKGA